MKVLLAFAFLLWVCTDAHHTPEHNLKEPLLVPRKTHRYELTINMTSGVPGLTSQLAKSIITADVNIRPKTESEYLLKIEHVKVSEPRSAVESDDEPIPMRRASQLESDLSKPIKFTLVDGEIKSYTLDPSESPESKKIKRSILRHLEVKVRDTNEKEVAQYYKGIEQNELFPYSYNISKDTLAGQVDSWYTVNVSPYPYFPYEENVFNISKTDNYEPAGYPAIHAHHNFVKQGCSEVCRKEIYPRINKYGAGCPVGYEPHQTPLNRYSTSHYNLRLEKGKMIFENILVEEKHIASMYDQDMVVTVSAEYNLVDITDKRIEEPQGQIEYTDLEVEPSPRTSQDAGTEADYFTDILLNIRGGEVVAEADRLLDEVVRTVVKSDIESQESQAVGEKLILIQRALSLVKKSHLDTIWRKIVDAKGRATEEEKVKRQILLDVLPLAGSDEIVKFIKYLIKENKVIAWEAKEILEALPENLINPNETIIKDLYEILEHRLVKQHHVVHSAAHLCLAKVFRKACVSPSLGEKTEGADEDSELFRSSRKESMRDSSSYYKKSEHSSRMSSHWGQMSQEPTSTECSSEFIDKFVNEITEKLRTTTKIQEKIIYIETLAHIGSNESLPSLLPYLYGTAKDLEQYADGDIDYIQTVTLYALHHIVGYYPLETLRFVAPIYFNRTEVPRVRNAAFSVIIRAQPPLSLWHQIALESWDEPSREVGSYVYSAMQSFGNSSSPCMKLTADRISRVFSQMKSHDIGEQHAKTIIKTFFDEVRNFAIEKRFAITPSNESVIPNNVYASVMYNIHSLKDVLMQIALNVQGVSEEEILKLFDAAVLSFRWPKDIPHDKEQEIFGKLNILPRLPKALRITIYKKFFYTSSYTYLDAETMWSTIEPLVEHLKNVYSVRRDAISGHFIKVLIPSSYHSIGYSDVVEFPVQFVMKHPVLLSLKAESNRRQPEGVAKIYLRPSVYHTTYYANEIISMVDHKAYGIYHEQKYTISMPVELRLNNSLEYNQLEVSCKWPELPTRIFRYHSEAGTYAGDVKLGKLSSTDNREPITTLPTLFEKEKVLSTMGLPALSLVAHTEDITDGIEDIPRDIDECVELAVKYLRNPGWRKKGLNATIVKPDGSPVDNVTFVISYNRTAVEPLTPLNQMNHANDMSAMDQMMQASRSDDESTEMPQKWGSWDKIEESGMKPVEAKRLKDKLVTRLSHVAHEFNVSMETSPTYRRFDLWVEYNHTFDSTLHSFKALASARSNERSRPKEVCMNHVMRYIHRPDEFKYDTKTYEMQRAYFYNEISFEECREFSSPDISTEGSMICVPHEKLFDKNEFTEDRRSEWFLPETHEECLQDVKDGKPLSIACMKAIKEEAIFNKLYLKTHWKKTIPEMIKNITLKVEQAIKYAYYSNADINRLNINNPESTAEITAHYINKLTDSPVLTVYMKTPIENIHYKKISAEYLYPFSSIYSFSETAMQEHTNNTYPPTCALMEKFVKTFDQKTFHLPQDECTYVLSTQCTEKKKFAVLAKQISSDKNTKEIQLFVEDHKIVLRPEQTTGSYMIHHNGHELTVNKDSPLMLHREAGIHAFLIPVLTSRSQLKTKYILVVHADNAGIEIEYDGKNVKLEVNPIYKGQLCGLCSEFDGEITREFRGVDQCLYLDSEDFAHSAIVDAEKCGVDTTPKKSVLCPSGENESPEYRHFSRYTTENPYNNDDEDEYRRDEHSMPKPRTIHIQRDEKVCFSTKPVPMCEDDLVPEEKERQSVDFHCLPKYDATTRKLVIESNRRTLRELSSKRVDFSETIYVAKACTSSN